LFVWVLPLFLVLLPYTTDSYGKNEKDIFCFIKTDNSSLQKNQTGRAWGGFILYIPVFLCMIFNTVTYMRSRKMALKLQVRLRYKIC
jgi:hypothetical protein